MENIESRTFCFYTKKQHQLLKCTFMLTEFN